MVFGTTLAINLDFFAQLPISPSDNPILTGLFESLSLPSLNS